MVNTETGSSPVVHPLLEFLFLLRRPDRSQEECHYRLKLSKEALKLALTLLHNLEYPLETFPDEGQFRATYDYVKQEQVRQQFREAGE